MISHAPAGIKSPRNYAVSPHLSCITTLIFMQHDAVSHIFAIYLPRIHIRDISHAFPFAISRWRRRLSLAIITTFCWAMPNNGSLSLHTVNSERAAIIALPSYRRIEQALSRPARYLSPITLCSYACSPAFTSSGMIFRKGQFRPASGRRFLSAHRLA